jgi:2-methylaconitate cis-trans-isomerase PrpF
MAVDADHDVSARLEKLRVEAAARMGMAESAAVPKIAFVAAPADYTALDGIRYEAAAFDVLGRAISMGNCHRAFPLTVAMCLAVAARIPGTVVNECVANQAGDVRLGHPSGVLPIAARVSAEGGEPKAETVTVYRTARRLMEGFVRVP